MKAIWQSFKEIPARNWFGLDFWIGIIAGAGVFAWTAFTRDTGYQEAATQLVSVVGIIIGAVLSGMAILTAFMDEEFIRKLHSIGKRAPRYVAPFVATVILGVFAEMCLLAYLVIPDHINKFVLSSFAAISAWAAFWTIGSLLACINFLLDFLGLRDDSVP